MKSLEMKSPVRDHVFFHISCTRLKVRSNIPCKYFDNVSDSYSCQLFLPVTPTGSKSKIC